jgi:hypothetical protein
MELANVWTWEGLIGLVIILTMALQSAHYLP